MKKVVVTALAALAALAIIASASASIAPANQKLTFEGPAVHAWHDGADSPRDKDSRALFLHVEAGEYVAAYSAKSIHIDKPAESVQWALVRLPDVEARRSRSSPHLDQVRRRHLRVPERELLQPPDRG